MGNQTRRHATCDIKLRFGLGPCRLRCVDYKVRLGGDLPDTGAKAFDRSFTLPVRVVEWDRVVDEHDRLAVQLPDRIEHSRLQVGMTHIDPYWRRGKFFSQKARQRAPVRPTKAQTAQVCLGATFDGVRFQKEARQQIRSAPVCMP